jgi:hypothetical protein
MATKEEEQAIFLRKGLNRFFDKFLFQILKLSESFAGARSFPSPWAFLIHSCERAQRASLLTLTQPTAKSPFPSAQPNLPCPATFPHLRASAYSASEHLALVDVKSRTNPCTNSLLSALLLPAFRAALSALPMLSRTTESAAELGSTARCKTAKRCCAACKHLCITSALCTNLGRNVSSSLSKTLPWSNPAEHVGFPDL